MEVLERILDRLPFPLIVYIGALIFTAWLMRELYGYTKYKKVFSNRYFKICGIAYTIMLGIFYLIQYIELPLSFFHSSRFTEPPDKIARIMITPFRVHSDSPQWEWAGSGTSDFLTIHLQQVAKTISILDPQLLLAEYHLAELKQLYSYLNVDHVISGSLNIVGLSCKLQVYITRVDTQKVVFAKEFTTSKRGFDAILDLQQKATIELMRTLKVGVSDDRDFEKFKALPASSLAAYEHYTKAIELTRQFQRRFSDRDYEAGRELKQQAITEYNKAIEIDSNFTWALNNLAVIYSTSFDREKAINYFRAAIKINPEYLEARLRLAFVLLEEYRFQHYTEKSADKFLEESLLQIEKVLSKQPRHIEALVLQGRIYLERKQYDTAISAIEKAVEASPKYSAAMTWLATCYLNAGREDDAIIRLKKAVEVDPQNARAHFMLGRELRSKGKSKEAIEHLRQAEINGFGDYGFEPSYLSYELGRAYLDIDDLRNAIMAYEPLFSMNPTLCFKALSDIKEFVEAKPHILKAMDKQTQNWVVHYLSIK